jgi:UDP-N-acetylmuramate dehydrogenase
MTSDGSLKPPDGLSDLQEDVALAPLTTLGLGGVARHLRAVSTLDDAVEAVRWARRRGEAVTVLGGGSNVVVADVGLSGFVLQAAFRGVEIVRDGETALVTAGAGEVWDELVAETVARGLAGLECLAGIPGLVGATPIQNVGAYGQEVGDIVETVRVLDLETLERRELSAEDCGFGYRSSFFRERPGRYLVLDVTYRLRPGGAPTLIYDELRRAISAGNGPPPTVGSVREAVLRLRRAKSMVLDPNDPNRRSVGSFFVNPVLETGAFREAERRGRQAGVLSDHVEIPRFNIGSGRLKVPAGWLIERAGFSKGMRRGPVGISSSHALALVHHGGGTAAQLVDLAREIRDGVRDTFGITLRPEPVFLGFDRENPLDPV